jgi:hypothetical protein
MIDANPEQLLALLLGGVVLELSVEEAKPFELAVSGALRGFGAAGWFLGQPLVAALGDSSTACAMSFCQRAGWVGGSGNTAGGGRLATSWQMAGDSALVAEATIWASATVFPVGGTCACPHQYQAAEWNPIVLVVQKPVGLVRSASAA